MDVFPCGIVITSLAKEVMFLDVFVLLFICLFACNQHYSKSYEQIAMEFYGGLWGVKWNSVACPD